MVWGPIPSGSETVNIFSLQLVTKIFVTKLLYRLRVTKARARSLTPPSHHPELDVCLSISLWMCNGRVFVCLCVYVTGQNWPRRRRSPCRVICCLLVLVLLWMAGGNEKKNLIQINTLKLVVFFPLSLSLSIFCLCCSVLGANVCDRFWCASKVVHQGDKLVVGGT